MVEQGRRKVIIGWWKIGVYVLRLSTRIQYTRGKLNQYQHVIVHPTHTNTSTLECTRSLVSALSLSTVHTHSTAFVVARLVTYPHSNHEALAASGSASVGLLPVLVSSGAEESVPALLEGDTG